MSWDAKVEPALEARTYRASTYPRQVIFASAGSLMHVVMALILAWASLTLVGLPSANRVEVTAFTQWQGHAKNAAQLAGMKIGDQIVSVNGKPVTLNNIDASIRPDAGKTITLVVDRAGHDLTLHATPVNGQTLTVDGKVLTPGKKAVGYIGIGLNAGQVRSSWLGAVPASFVQLVARQLWRAA